MQQKVLLGFILTMAIVIFIPVYWAMEPGRQETARIRQQTEAIERGAKTYGTACALCHGAQGEGIVGPALKEASLDDGALAKIIARGVPGTAMLAWGVEDGGPLKKHQINDLVIFIKNWDSTPEIQTSSEETAPPATETTSEEIDASKIFTSRCSGCHGANREGTAGFAPALTPESLAKLSDTEIGETILSGRSGTAMPAFKDALSAEEIDALLRFIKYTSP